MSKCRKCPDAIDQLDIDEYSDPVALLGHGSYGVVTEHTDPNGNPVVIKSSTYKQTHDQLGADTVNEISTLATLQGHPNIVRMFGSSVEPRYVEFNGDGLVVQSSIVMEKAQSSLADAIKNQILGGADNDAVVNAMYQIVQGVNWMHRHNIMHRDIKPGNILVMDDEINGWPRVVISDFGMSKSGPYLLRPLSTNVYTLWYRPPEILVKPSQKYNNAADMWAVGRTFWDLLARPNDTLFRAHDRDHQFRNVFRTLDSPSFFGRFPWTTQEKKAYYKSQFWPEPENDGDFDVRDRLEKRLGYKMTDDTWDLLSGLLSLDPKKRYTMEQALNHPYFERASVPYAQVPVQDLTASLVCKEEDLRNWKNVTTWMLRVTEEFRLPYSAYFLATHILKCLFAVQDVQEKDLQLYGAAALGLADLYVSDFPKFTVDDASMASNYTFTSYDFIDTQKALFYIVGTKLYLPSTWGIFSSVIQARVTPEQFEKLPLPRIVTALTQAEINHPDMTPAGIVEQVWLEEIANDTDLLFTLDEF